MSLKTVAGGASGMPVDVKMHDQVYDALSEALIQGKIPPLKSVSLRGLAQDLNVSAMPVREAVRRLIAEKALEMQAHNKRLRVPPLDEHRLKQLMTARQWVEPELACLAARRMSKDAIRRLREDDERLMAAVKSGDVSEYMQRNHDFHFTIYRQADAGLFCDMARMLWLQTGPFMRVVFGRLGTAHLSRDHHQDMIRAFEEGDADTARASMSADIHEGMQMMLEALQAEAQPEIKRRKRG